MRAYARIAVTADPVRGTRLDTLRGEPPLLPRRTGWDDGELRVHLVGGAAGPLGGDDLRIDVEVGPGARLCVRSVAASLALPGRTGVESRLHVTVRVAAGGRLRWLVEPLIGAAGCDHRTVTEIELAEGAALLWREELVCGRHAEPVGDVRVETTLRYGGRTLLRNDLAVGPRAVGWSGAAVLGDARAAGTVLVVDPAWTALPPPHAGAAGPDGGPIEPRDGKPDGCAAAVLPLAGGPAVLVSAVAADPRSVRAQLDRLSARWSGPEQSPRHGADLTSPARPHAGSEPVVPTSGTARSTRPARTGTT
ncbi:urease accessory protein UreD [Micromonospora sp. WMMD1102]|uniref:urease accessory protein UreD n=1 Tax=Micromonospora sp. WMMD1102 TaxID=3016105 RepID=UPI00241588F5|nr:urease accessory protein UreD [Micromonospora sp. WMMD1102]MDG4788283.1 urease accessory protein UreD [Micromonospora sp. WMMD1102]